MAYQQKDFLSCRYNPLDKDFAKKYANLFSIVPNQYTGNKELLLRYICALYDYRSPLIIDTASIDTRKRIAAQLVGLELNEEKLSALFELQDELIIEIIDRFLKEHINERLAYMIFANEQTFYEYGKRLLQPVKWDSDAKEKDLLSAITIKTKLSEDMKAINTRIEEDTRRLYMDDSQLQKSATKKRFTPEDYANI